MRRDEAIDYTPVQLPEEVDEGPIRTEVRRMRDRREWILLGLLLGASLILAVLLPLADDEVYYWCWAKELQFSYFDHPPMTACLIRVSTTIFGDTPFGLRVPACLANAFVLFAIARLSRSRALLPWIACTPLFTLGSVLITPDAPLMMFWAAYVGWLVEVHRRLSRTQADVTSHHSLHSPTIPWRLWLLGGVLLGAGVLSKYTMALAVPAGCASFLFVSRRWREWLPGYVFHGAVSFVVASPILIHNIQHDFVPLLFQWQHTMGRTQSGLKPFAEFIGVQMLLFGTLPLFLFPWVLRNFRRLARASLLRVCCCMYALPWAFFLYKATRSPLEGNWALVSFIAFWPLAATWYSIVRKSRFWRRSVASSFIPPIICVIGLALHFVHPLPVIPINGDRISRQVARTAAVRQAVETIRERGENLPVYAPTYQLTALLRFHGVEARQIDGLTRPSHFTQQPRHLDEVDRAYVVTEQTIPDIITARFAPAELIASYPITVRGTVTRTLLLQRYTRQRTVERTEQTTSGLNGQETLPTPRATASPAVLPE